MPRLRNTATGVVVNVSEQTAKSLDGSYTPVSAAKPKQQTTRPKRAPAKKSGKG